MSMKMIKQVIATNKSNERDQGHGRWQRGRRAPLWVFIHDTNIVDRGL